MSTIQEYTPRIKNVLLPGLGLIVRAADFTQGKENLQLVNRVGAGELVISAIDAQEGAIEVCRVQVEGFRADDE